MRPLHLAAIAATVLVAWTGVHSLTRPPVSLDRMAKKPKPAKVSHNRCTIQRAVFGGTEAAVLKILKDRVLHYVVLDLPSDDPHMPDHQSRWLAANFGATEPSAIVGVFPSVEDAVAKAASLCPSN